jgi:hypothetical protein
MSKLNPQKASAYVGPGVLRKGGNITPVPNGPLIKKKGPFKGSTLKAGGTIKKAQMGSSMFKDNPIYKKTTDLRGKIGSAALGMPGIKPVVKNGSKIKKAQEGTILNPRQEARRKLDSITAIKRADIIRKKDSIFERNARAKGMTKEELSNWQTKNARKSDQGPSGGDSSSGSGLKSPCKGGFCTGLNKSKNGSMLKRKIKKK